MTRVEISGLTVVRKTSDLGHLPKPELVECPTCWALVMADKIVEHLATHAGPGLSPDGR